MGMKQSLSGLLVNAATELERHDGDESLGPYYAFGLRELLQNLTLVRADPKLLSEFFDLYVV